eukprot:4404562-Lingulodinium_polyedra.AAC.1
MRAQPARRLQSSELLVSNNFEPLTKFLAWTALTSAKAEEDQRPIVCVGFRQSEEPLKEVHSSDSIERK